MRQAGEEPRDLARRLPPGSYRFTGPVQRSGLTFARVTHRTDREPMEAGLTPAGDVMSLHFTDFGARTWREGRLIHSGSIRRRSLSLVKRGVRADVRLVGDVDIVQVFLSPSHMAELAAELIAWPVEPTIESWIYDEALSDLTMRAFRASISRHRAAHLAAESLSLFVAEHLLRFHSRSCGGSERVALHAGCTEEKSAAGFGRRAVPGTCRNRMVSPAGFEPATY